MNDNKLTELLDSNDDAVDSFDTQNSTSQSIQSVESNKDSFTNDEIIYYKNYLNVKYPNLNNNSIELLLNDGLTKDPVKLHLNILGRLYLHAKVVETDTERIKVLLNDKKLMVDFFEVYVEKEILGLFWGAFSRTMKRPEEVRAREYLASHLVIEDNSKALSDRALINKHAFSILFVNKALQKARSHVLRKLKLTLVGQSNDTIHRENTHILDFAKYFFATVLKDNPNPGPPPKIILFKAAAIRYARDQIKSRTTFLLRGKGYWKAIDKILNDIFSPTNKEEVKVRLNEMYKNDQIKYPLSNEALGEESSSDDEMSLNNLNA